MKLFKDYDCKILYHPSKGNAVVDALYRKNTSMLAHIMIFECQLIKTI